MNRIIINPLTDALIRIDIQKDFQPGGALAVEGGHEITEQVNVVSRMFRYVADTQDWHPGNHKSFASTWKAAVFSTTTLGYGTQVLWPDHCVQGSQGAEFDDRLDTTMTCVTIRKGMNPEVDSYSAFFENDKVTPTGLAAYLKERGITRVFLCGLAYDFCVGFSALDAIALGFEVYVIEDLCRAIDMHGSLQFINDKFVETGVQRIDSDELEAA